MLIWELFKVAGGLIRRIEAIGAAFPYGMRARLVTIGSAA